MEQGKPAFPADESYQEALGKRKEQHLYRTWSPIPDAERSDFISNDYLGFSRDGAVFKDPAFSDWLKTQATGSTGSRLVSGQSQALVELEAFCCEFFQTEACIFFPNGYLANLALLSTAAGRNDTYIYDEQCHVSLKDGMRLSLARRVSFRHNDPEDLRRKLQSATGRTFIVTESLFSMEGDCCPLKEVSELAREFQAHLILDEAHSTGTFGAGGKGLSLTFPECPVWARIYTFGKALGASGAVLAVTPTTKEYLINFSHPVIYSTAPMPAQAGLCLRQLQRLNQEPERVALLQNRIQSWLRSIPETDDRFSRNPDSPVQYVRVKGNEEAITITQALQRSGIQTKAMLSPTVPAGLERIRISLHSFNTDSEIQDLISHLREF